MNVVPGRQRGLVGATLLKAAFDRAAYGCKLFCCWCAQDLAANRFWEAMGFVPLAFRTGGRAGGPAAAPGPTSSGSGGSGAGDATTPYWYPARRPAGASARTGSCCRSRRGRTGPTPCRSCCRRSPRSAARRPWRGTSERRGATGAGGRDPAAGTARGTPKPRPRPRGPGRSSARRRRGPRTTPGVRPSRRRPCRRRCRVRATPCRCAACAEAQGRPAARRRGPGTPRPVARAGPRGRAAGGDGGEVRREPVGRGAGPDDGGRVAHRDGFGPIGRPASFPAPRGVSAPGRARPRRRVDATGTARRSAAE